MLSSATSYVIVSQRGDEMGEGRGAHLVDERVYAMLRNGLSEWQHHQDGNLAHWQRGGLAGSPGALVLR